MVLTKDDVEDIVKLLLINNQKDVQGYVIATLYFKIGEYHNALKYVSRYLCIEPNSFHANKLQGECYEKLNRNDDALKSFKKALKSVDKKNDLEHSGENQNVDEIRKKMGKIEIFSSSVVNGKGRSTAKTESIEVMVEAAHSSTSTSTPKANTNDDGTCSEITFEFRVNHITSLDCANCSETFCFQNLLWRIVVMPYRDLGACRSLSVYLICDGRSDLSQWSCHVDAEIRLLSVRPNQYPCERKTRHLFSKTADAWGFPAFLSWYDAVRPDGNYMRDDCITVQVYLKVLQ
ncbi:ubiquitin carboxyl-terminal hydrolase 7-like isoform X1 [Bradysia coprophila]|uniref:ubiquitin carboxyl-terminal hydrolase 7-like isoform X1 n=1 Tax=Bradysia coprophila TaxID=38358 RepID=UPI00187DA4F7|nr:ubiquitin carboxyl-terminal hydrolase 7-like isoform X1 [Bradysia coprophila]